MKALKRWSQLPLGLENCLQPSIYMYLHNDMTTAVEAKIRKSTVHKLIKPFTGNLYVHLCTNKCIFLWFFSVTNESIEGIRFSISTQNTKTNKQGFTIYLCEFSFSSSPSIDHETIINYERIRHLCRVDIVLNVGSSRCWGEYCT
jgi:hypothetical protein